MTKKKVALADAKKRLSELVGRVVFGGEQFVITRRGREAAILGPIGAPQGRKSLAEVRGWLEDDDPFFRYIAEVRERSRRRGPRVWRRRR